MTPFELLYAVPAYRRQIHAGHMVQLGGLKGALGDQLQVTWADTCSLDWARNILVWGALHRMPSRWLLMCDADTFHPRTADILMMLDEGTRRGAAVIAAPVRCRGELGHPWNVALLTDDGEELFPSSDLIVGRVSVVHRIGTAFMAVSMRWIVDHWLTGPWFQSEQVYRGEKEPPGWIGEDYAFCDGVRRRGGLILADGRFEPAHSGAVSESAVWARSGAATAISQR